MSTDYYRVCPLGADLIRPLPLRAGLSGSTSLGPSSAAIRRHLTTQRLVHLRTCTLVENKSETAAASGCNAKGHWLLLRSSLLPSSRGDRDCVCSVRSKHHSA